MPKPRRQAAVVEADAPPARLKLGTLRDRLSKLTFTHAAKLLGPDGKRLLSEGGRYDILIDEQVFLGDDLFRLSFPEERISVRGRSQPTVATITLMADKPDRLHLHCTGCGNGSCVHLGAAFSLALDEKTALGLATAPPEFDRSSPYEMLTETQLVERALAERKERAQSEPMRVKSQDAEQPWADYVVTNTVSGKSYRVALRGLHPGDSYCNCPDFRTNTLGTCKHILHVLEKVRRKFDAKQLAKPFVPDRMAIHLRYGKELQLHWQGPSRLTDDVEQIIKPWRKGPIVDVHDLLKRIGKLEQLGEQVLIFPDAEQFLDQKLHEQRIANLVADIRKDPARHPLRTSLLKTELLPYQLDGIAFAIGAGRAILADEMGLGKTIQGVGVAELFAREAGIRRVLVVCPASLKAQWRNEIQRFGDRDVQLVTGGAEQRGAQYRKDCFFTVCNYEQVLRDILSVEQVMWDLIILDEGQRIKNWEAKTTRIIKGLRSRFALVLSGTPLENRLEELFSVVQFIDDRRLAPAFRFFHRYRVVDENGKVAGYKNLDGLRETLKPILLRRTRVSVKQDLPPRTTEIVRIAPTDEQKEIDAAQMQIVSSIVHKKFITEMDLLRLQKALLLARMAADSTFLVNKEPPGYSTKLERLDELLEQLLDEPDRKILVFSEWTTMLGLIEPLVKKRKAQFVRLEGRVPQKQRQQLVHRFQNDPECRVFLTTNAGSTGLNLQAANTVINVDLPWNPAVLEQRIARAHRMGQKQPVHAFLLVTEQTPEESLLTTLSAKKDLALAALDVDSDIDEVSLVSGAEELRNRLEVLLGAKPQAPLDVSQRVEVVADVDRRAHRDRVAAAGGELLGAVFNFLGELVSQQEVAAQPAADTVDSLKQRLAECVEEDDQGRQRLSITLPNREMLDKLAATLARLLVAKP
jgi:hypothetical protein